MTENSRNVLFIVIDQLRADCLDGALAAHVDLPNLKAFQSESVSFQNHFTVAVPCGPARASLLTGQYTMNHRSVRNGTPLARDIASLASEARAIGYDPLLFGYTDTAIDPRGRSPKDPAIGNYELPMDGFNQRVEMRLGENLPWRAYLKAKGYELPQYRDFFNPVAKNRAACLDDPPFYRAEDSDTAFLTDRFLEEMAIRETPGWFAHLTYIRPHPPLVAPEPYNKMYDPDALPAPIAAGKMHAFTQIADLFQPISNMASGSVDVTKADTQQLRALYFGLASEVDFHIGRVIEFLKKSGQYDNTLIVITADHGEMLGDHGLWAKNHVYDQSFKISLMIRDPSKPDHFGTRVEALTESIDVTPTILGWLGKTAPKSMNGVDLRPFLAGEKPDNWREFVHMELDFAEGGRDLLAHGNLVPEQANLAILRSKTRKLVHFGGGFKPLLFDLTQDPDEQNNLAEHPERQGELLEMTQALLGLRMRHMDNTLSEI